MCGGYYNPHWIEDSYSQSEDVKSSKDKKVNKMIYAHINPGCDSTADIHENSKVVEGIQEGLTNPDKQIADAFKKMGESAAKTAKSIGLIVGDEKIEHPDTDIPDPFAPPTPEMRDMIEKTADKMERTNIMSSSELERALQNSSDKPHILDSGNRREFGTGAVRDIQEGKGRCDLLPLDVVGRYLEDPIVGSIAEFQQTGSVDPLFRILWDFATHWGSEPERRHEANSTMLLEVSKHYEEGCIKYGERNWQKGIPVRCYIDSAVRHYLKFIRGDKDEPHDRAFCWNILGAIWTCVYKPELCEYPIKLEVEV